MSGHRSSSKTRAGFARREHGNASGGDFACDLHDLAAVVGGESRELAGGSVGIKTVHFLADQAFEVPAQLRFINLARRIDSMAASTTIID